MENSRVRYWRDGVANHAEGKMTTHPNGIRVVAKAAPSRSTCRGRSRSPPAVAGRAFIPSAGTSAFSAPWSGVFRDRGSFTRPNPACGEHDPRCYVGFLNNMIRHCSPPSPSFPVTRDRATSVHLSSTVQHFSCGGASWLARTPGSIPMEKRTLSGFRHSGTSRRGTCPG
jgi:hypothetical protein